MPQKQVFWVKIDPPCNSYSALRFPGEAKSCPPLYKECCAPSGLAQDTTIELGVTMRVTISFVTGVCALSSI